eukprot:365261-Chlamydomonas_euryale.AAC.10
MPRASRLCHLGQGRWPAPGQNAAAGGDGAAVSAARPVHGYPAAAARYPAVWAAGQRQDATRARGRDRVALLVHPHHRCGATRGAARVRMQVCWHACFHGSSDCILLDGEALWGMRL